MKSSSFPETTSLARFSAESDKFVGVQLMLHNVYHNKINPKSKSSRANSPELLIMVPSNRILAASGDRMRHRRTSCRHGDYQTNFLRIQICKNYNQLILFQFFRLFLVSFGNVWPCVGQQLIPEHNSQFTIHLLRKSNFLSVKAGIIVSSQGEGEVNVFLSQFFPPYLPKSVINTAQKICEL